MSDHQIPTPPMLLEAGDDEPRAATSADLLARLGGANVEEPSIARVSREIQLRADPARVAPARPLRMPWTLEARVHTKAREAALEARLDVFRDDLRAIRIANEVLNRAATMRAVEAAEIAIFEIRNLGETARLAISNRAQLEMTRQFVAQLESIETFRGRVTPEILEALKERAFTEFTERLTRASRSDLSFAKADILGLKP